MHACASQAVHSALVWQISAQPKWKRQGLGAWLQIAAVKKTIKEEEQRHRHTTADTAHEVSFSIEEYVWCAFDTPRRLCQCGIHITLQLLVTLLPMLWGCMEESQGTRGADWYRWRNCGERMQSSGSA